MNIRRSIVVAMLVYLPSGAVAQDEKPDVKPKGIDKATIAAWEKRGFESGWMGIDSRRGEAVFAAEPKDCHGAVPAFKAGTAVKNLKDLPEVEVPFGLYLETLRVTDEELKYLAGLKNLTALNLRGSQVPDAGQVSKPDGGLTEFAGLTNLTSLSVWSVQVTNAGLKQIAGLKNLSTLSLTGPRANDAWLMELAALKNLTFLDVSFSRSVSDEGMKHLAELSKLETIRLSYTGVTSEGLKHLAGLKNLRCLILDNNWIGERGIKPLAAIPSLTTIDLLTDRHSEPVTDAGLKELTVLKRLSVLRVSSSKITDAGLKAIGGLPDLRELVLGQAPISDAGLRHLAALKSLTTLTFVNVPLTDAGLKELAAIKNLKSLSIQYSNVTDAGIKELQQVLPNCKITK